MMVMSRQSMTEGRAQFDSGHWIVWTENSYRAPAPMPNDSCGHWIQMTKIPPKVALKQSPISFFLMFVKVQTLWTVLLIAFTSNQKGKTLLDRLERERFHTMCYALPCFSNVFHAYWNFFLVYRATVPNSKVTAENHSGLIWSSSNKNSNRENNSVGF